MLADDDGKNERGQRSSNRPRRPGAPRGSGPSTTGVERGAAWRTALRHLYRTAALRAGTTSDAAGSRRRGGESPRVPAPRAGDPEPEAAAGARRRSPGAAPSAARAAAPTAPEGAAVPSVRTSAFRHMALTRGRPWREASRRSRDRTTPPRGGIGSDSRASSEGRPAVHLSGERRAAWLRCDRACRVAEASRRPPRRRGGRARARRPVARVSTSARRSTSASEACRPSPASLGAPGRRCGACPAPPARGLDVQKAAPMAAALSERSSSCVDGRAEQPGSIRNPASCEDKRLSHGVCVPYDACRSGQRPAPGLPPPAVLRLQAFSAS